jgi:electron transfer flavoprotein alpha subunit
MNKNIIVIAEYADSRVKPVTYETISLARMLPHAEKAAVRVVILGTDVKKPAGRIAQISGCDVTAIQLSAMATYNTEMYVTALGRLLPDLHPAYVCIPHTSQGADYAPALAMALKAACISGVEDLKQLESKPCFERALYGAKIVARIRPLSETTVLTIQPGVFKFEASHQPAPGKVTAESMAYAPSGSKSLGIKQSRVDTAGITEADVIVAAGQGIGEKDNLELIRNLASVFPKSAVAGSRIVCDRGWLDYSCQVGVTGATVSPRLYIACGLSGALQHVTGMRGSEFIVAVNKDPSAAIFQVSDVCVVEDLTTFIPEFIEACKNADIKVLER